MPDERQAEQPAKRGRGRPRKLPPPEDRRTVRLNVTAAELERVREAVAHLRKQGEADLSQAVFAQRAVVAAAEKVLQRRPKRK